MDQTSSFSIIDISKKLHRLQYLEYEFGDSAYTLRAWRDAVDDLVRELDEGGLLSEIIRHLENNNGTT